MTHTRRRARRPTATAAAATTAAAAVVAAAAWAALHATSPRVRLWRRGAGRVVAIHGTAHSTGHGTALGSRVFGSGDTVVVLLPGIAASERFFGEAWNTLADVATVVALDPLGFGTSRDHPLSDSFDGSREHHLAAISATLDALGFDDRPVIVAGHSMGASLAIQWAAVDPRARAVVAFDAPLYETRDEARERVGSMGWFERLLSNGPLAERVCAWMCAHRRAAAAIAVVGNPTLPIPVAAAGVQHTWPAYISAFDELVAGRTWIEALDALAAGGVPVHLVNGTDDPVPVPGRASALAARHATVTARTHPGGHDLPLVAAGWCSILVRGVVTDVVSTPGTP
ncbi:alpha/beta fold hydrolase [Marisediminicola sp. LYQ134]|uniref:alpha/beta fold hydrolase n=1 Tax=Marisediminicola sp. LYQ134 TaxID=3391061 RepID=UPI00398300DF